MTLRTPPSWLQNGSHPAENDRLTTQALWATTGIIKSTSLAVTPNSPVGMSVIIASGWAAIVGTTQSNMGTYVAYNDAATVVAITTANPTNPRIDLLCATVQDAFYTGAQNNVIFQVVVGTPASSPVVPALPANSIALAEIDVAAGALSITSGDITDLRVLVTTNIPESGDISAVVAGTGLTGGGTSGSVTLAIDSSVVAEKNLTINAQTGTTYTTVLADNGKLVTQTNASAITTTIPPNSSVAYPVGAQINVVQLGSGQVTFAQGAGVTIVSTGATASAPALRAQYSTATAIQTATDTWLVVGDIA
jgi:hypothetical protein